jgi:cell division protein FtsN
VRTDGEAQAIQARVRGDLAPVFEAREAMVDEAVVGNFGSMYRVRVGPYASAGEGQAVCARLKGSGLDCLVVTQ